MNHPKSRATSRPPIVLLLPLLLSLLALRSALPAGAEPTRSAAAAIVAETTGLFGVLDRSWIDDAYWYDGTAEINLYEATLIKYGQPREADELVHIFVTEDHDPELLVKADDWRRPGLVPMLKLNYVTSVRTGVYRYEQMLSFFFDRRTLGMAKMTLSSHEWCGNSSKEIVHFAGSEGEDRRESFDFNTYWDGQGNGSYEVDYPDDLVVYDSLPGQLRALPFAAGLTATFQLLPTQLSSRVTRPVTRSATVEVTGRETVEVPAGSFDAWRIELCHAGGVDRLAFEAAFPHRMVEWRQAAGDVFRLKKSEKMAYWAKAGVGNEGLLQDGPSE